MKMKKGMGEKGGRRGLKCEEREERGTNVALKIKPPPFSSYCEASGGPSPQLMSWLPVDFLKFCFIFVIFLRYPGGSLPTTTTTTNLFDKQMLNHHS